MFRKEPGLTKKHKVQLWEVLDFPKTESSYPGTLVQPQDKTLSNEDPSKTHRIVCYFF